ncbi:hypothetical protein V1499_09955 [Neobacillus sp. SCS-31]|uniref:hypothetical protein n=1 Tax=Neobacillus oceani TaxID=3115292 RepID=UPI003906B7C7
MNFSSFFVSFLTSTLVVSLFQYLSQAGVNNFFTKKLELFKEQINITAEQRQYEYEKKIQNFNLFSSRKHEIYPELYKIIKKAYDTLSIYEINTTLPRLENIKSIDLFLKDRNIPNEFLSKVYERWQGHDVPISFILQRILSLYTYEMTRKLITDAHDYYYGVDIYLPEELSETISLLLRNMIFLITAYGSYAETGIITDHDIDFDKQLKYELQDYMKTVKENIRKELSNQD